MSQPPKGSIPAITGTRKGAFIFRSDAQRKIWMLEGWHFAGSHAHSCSTRIREVEAIVV